jgi:esterase/lipase superfamily enzyme/tetratricopeptide (TPR) repeat protein
VPVASAAEFVGRRREAQRILRAFRDRDRAGVLIHGLGRQGKSSLAARIANRMPGHDTVVIYEHYDALAVFEALRNALPARLQAEFDQTWREQVTRDASNLRNALLDMLEGPFRTTDPATRSKPVLLIVDDLEQILETPKPGEANTPVKTDYIVALASVIAAFRDADTESRLLLTGRYTFALTDARGEDLAARLVPVQLPPMDETQRDKQLRAAARLAGADYAGHAADQNRAALEARIKEAAKGNPGLQAILFRPMLSGDTAATIRAVEAVESYLESGEIPKDAHAAADFFTHVSLTAFKDMLTPQETQQLRAATSFSVPVPRPALEAAGEAASVKEPVGAIERLRGLGLIDLYLAAGAKEELAINTLARPLVPLLSEAEIFEIAERAIRPLYAGWKDAEGGLPIGLRGWEASRLALLGKAPPEIVNASSRAAVVFLFRTLRQAEPALDVVLSALTALDRAEATPDLHLLRHGADCAERLGKAEIQEMLLERGLAIEDGDPPARAMLMFGRGSRLIQTGEIDAAEELLKEAAAVFESLGDVRERAVTMGRIADILQVRGQFDEALKIRTEEELPVYERLSDVRERAVTMGKIADIVQTRGQFDEALKIRTEEELPVYERLGDVRERAVTMGKIADILRIRGQLDEALKIRTEEELPVYERLGDVRERAVTMGKIADILQVRGQFDEALKIRKEEELPVYERLGDVRSRAVTMGRIADILQARGQFDEALKIRTEEQLPVYERLGDVHSRAVTMGKIADILQARGQLDEALKIWQEAVLPAMERLGDVRSRAVTIGKIADILQARGQLDEALKIRTEEELPVYERLGDVRSRAMTMGRIADILQARGQLDEALKIRTEEELPVYERLSDVRERAVTMGKIADILQATGRFNEALPIYQKVLYALQALGDVRMAAVAMGKVADILQARGQLDEALKIRKEEELPVYGRLGDVRSRAVTMGKIADILQVRGQFDEALRIRKEEELPVYERLGDVRERAVTMGRIADVLQARGQFDESLKIRTEEQLPVYERLGDAPALLVGRTNLAITLLQRAKDGDRHEARNLLNLALNDARRLNRPEAGQIEQIIARAGFGSTSTEGAQIIPPSDEIQLDEKHDDGVHGYPADRGWDAVTGLGRPDGTNLLDLVSPAPSADLDASGPPSPLTRGISEAIEHPSDTSAASPKTDKAEYVVWYGTNRRPNDRNDAGKGYSTSRDNVVHYGSCRVFIPESHKIGSTGSPWWKRLLTWTDDRLRLLSVEEVERGVYWGGIGAQLAVLDADERSALIFVHGYNVPFQEASLRAAQIGFDLSVKGAMAFFSWPSQGSTGGYPADEATIEASEGVIADFMTDFAERSGATAVHIIAHSMGNRGVLRAVNRIAAQAQRRTGKPFGQIILAAADVDADVFRQLSAAYAEVAARTTLYVSKRDLAVEASRWLHNFPRAGLMPPTLVLPGIDTINVTNVDLTMLGHGYVADARDVLIDMHALITQGASPDKRFGLREAKNEEGERYWLIGA